MGHNNDTECLSYTHIQLKGTENDMLTLWLDFGLANDTIHIQSVKHMSNVLLEIRMSG